MDHVIVGRSGIGTTARIVQSQHLRFSHVTVSDPVLIIVKFGRKELHAPGFHCVLEAGDAVAIGQNQSLDITNTPGPDGQYQAEWLVWDPALISGYVPRNPGSRAVGAARNLGRVAEEFSRSIEIAFDALRRPNEVPRRTG